MKKAIDKILADKFIKLLEQNAFYTPNGAVCSVQEELTKTLSEEQQKLFAEMDILLADSDTINMERAFRIGFLEGLKVGGRILS